jgi:AraC-like DNA-binding protein
MFLKYAILFLGILYFIFASVLLLKRSPHKKANQLLSFFFFLLTIYSVEFVYYYNAMIDKEYSHLIYYAPFDLFLILMLGPALLRYVKVFLGVSVGLSSNKILIQLLPFIPPVIYIVYFFSQDVSTRINLLIVDFEKGIWPITFLNLIVCSQVTFYLLSAYRVIRNQLIKSSTVFVDNIQVDVFWLKTYITLNISFLAIIALLYFFSAGERLNILIAQLTIAVQFVYLFVKSMWSKELVSAEIMHKNNCIENENPMANNLIEHYKSLFLDYIERERPYLLGNCSIQYISDKTGISVDHLSTILNTYFRRKFPEFINEYRVLEAIRLLRVFSPGKITMGSIGYECGFCSKSSFTKTFKKHTSLTPMEFHKNIWFS